MPHNGILVQPYLLILGEVHGVALGVAFGKFLVESVMFMVPTMVCGIVLGGIAD